MMDAGTYEEYQKTLKAKEQDSEDQGNSKGRSRSAKQTHAQPVFNAEDETD